MITYLTHDIRYGFRSTGGPGTALGVFLLALVLFPLLMGPEPDVLRKVGPGLMWLMAGLAALLYAPPLIQEDLEDGTLIQLLLIPTSSIKIFLMKALAHFIMIGVPFTILSLLASPLYDLAAPQTMTLTLTFLIGLPAISLLSILGSTLCASAKGGNLLILILILPLMTPLFIFALSAVDAVGLGLSAAPHLLLLMGLALLVSVLATSAGGYVLRGVS